MVVHPAGPVSAMSVRRSPLKSPVRMFTPGVAAHAAKSGRGLFLTSNDPSPRDSATGSEPQPAPAASAMSVLPSPLKSPVRILTPGTAAHAAKSPAGRFVTLKLPLRFENATGTVVQPGGPSSAMSEAPSPLKSPTSLVAGTRAGVPAAMHPRQGAGKTMPLSVDQV